MSEVRSTFRLAIGDSAPDFSLPDADGNEVSFADSRGEKGTLVVFACNHCPYVIHVAEALAQLADEMAAEGISTVVINSNDLEKYPQDGPEKMREFSAENEWDFPYLVDESQEVALAYGAACTPDFFLFDGDEKLYYAGQFDDTRPSDNDSADGADMREAMEQLLEGDAPPENPFPSSGCNIKWKPGNQPDWWASGND